ncbi:putative transcriptional regulator, TetR family protein [Sphaerisporangium krabiense]|uniref:AcrR family transcriptional regulator n=1 Tax=Sphaerisporangium krabiense TaxID=763782 RepID=A0A7W8Z918_9ACTN|nr:TetR/AcrR family transcriptional regulator C-terminal domain-containing protein [Sphaerisporangium krabiense]MBB5629525.1 AcrR family transcriptional regulator [Sphaerisporangium krabiense]GII65622.1 putative transcriptional regulator, TetR family protein [Sphaerisporangium krabiense]
MTTRKDKQPPRQALSREQVIDAALELIDRHGVEALTMRRLAEVLEVYPATIYWHAGNRAQLIARVCQRVFEGIELPDADSVPWTEWILQLAHRSRERLGRHPNLAVDFTSTIQISASSLTMADRLLAVLEDAKFTGEQLVMVYNTVLGGIFGWIAAEFASEPVAGDSDWVSEYQHALREGGGADLPAIHRNFFLVANRAFMLRWSSGRSTPMESSFDFAMRTMIAGLERMRDA